MDDEELRRLAKLAAKKRGYAGFFDWPDKRQKELGILQCFVQGAARLGVALENDRLEDEHKDPPDAWATYAGAEIALELTEFVDSDLIGVQVSTKRSQWRFWTGAEVEAKLRDRIHAKDHSGFGSASQYWLVVHCDEPALDAALLERYVAALPIIETRALTRCFFLLSFAPSIDSYPVIEVRVQPRRTPR
jgi:hypothetical protein